MFHRVGAAQIETRLISPRSILIQAIEQGNDNHEPREHTLCMLSNDDCGAMLLGLMGVEPRPDREGTLWGQSPLVHNHIVHISHDTIV